MALGTFTRDELVSAVRAMIQQYSHDKMTSDVLAAIVNRKVFAVFLLLDKSVKEAWYSDTLAAVPALDAVTGYYSSAKPVTMWDSLELNYFIWNDRVTLEEVKMKFMDERIRNPLYDGIYFAIRGENIYYSWSAVPSGTLALWYIRLPVKMSAADTPMDIPDPYVDLVITKAAIDAIIGSNIDSEAKQAALQALYLKDKEASQIAGLPLTSSEDDDLPAPPVELGSET